MCKHTRQWAKPQQRREPAHRWQQQIDVTKGALRAYGSYPCPPSPSHRELCGCHRVHYMQLPLVPQQQPFLPLTPGHEQGPSPHGVSGSSAPGSCCPSRRQSCLHALVATPYGRARSKHVCFCEFNSLMPRHELVEPRCSHTPPRHSAANIKTQQTKSSLPRACGIQNQTCVMGT